MFSHISTASLPDNVNARSTHFEEIVLGRHTPGLHTEDALKDSANLLRDGTRSSLDELLATNQLQESVNTVEVLVKHALGVLLDQLSATEFADSGLFLGELLHRDGDNLVRGKSHHLDADVLDVSVSLLEESGDLKIGFLGGILRGEIEAGCVEDDKGFGVLVGSAERSNDKIRVGDQTLGFFALKVSLEFRNAVGNAVNDDGILDPSTQPQLSVLDDAKITGPEPTALNKALFGSGGVVVVLDEQHRATDLEFAGLSITKGGDAILRRDNTHFQTTDSASKGQELGGHEILSRVGEGARDTVIDGTSAVR